MWSLRYRPRSASQLAVHPKKVQEVREWVEETTRRRTSPASSSSGILLLRGPSGCGKSSTVRALCADMGVALQEWRPPNEVVKFEERKGGLLDLEGSEGRRGGGGGGDDALPFVSQTRAFRDFLLRAKRYGVIGENTTKKIVNI